MWGLGFGVLGLGFGVWCLGWGGGGFGFGAWGGMFLWADAGLALGFEDSAIRGNGRCRIQGSC